MLSGKLAAVLELLNSSITLANKISSEITQLGGLLYEIHYILSEQIKDIPPEIEEDILTCEMLLQSIISNLGNSLLSVPGLRTANLKIIKAKAKIEALACNCQLGDQDEN